jgi:hypothetical protein
MLANFVHTAELFFERTMIKVVGSSILTVSSTAQRGIFAKKMIEQRPRNLQSSAQI